MLIESSLPRYSNVFGQRKPLAQKIGLQLVTCFCNLETFLNLEFEAGKQSSSTEKDHDLNGDISDGSPFKKADSDQDDADCDD